MQSKKKALDNMYRKCYKKTEITTENDKMITEILLLGTRYCHLYYNIFVLSINNINIIFL